ncbi:hypothetical protein ACQKH8_10280, partial [Staphylococcus aureus]
MIYETAPAKINFTLDTLFKRNDGYHEIEIIMTTVDLNDRLTFHKRKDHENVYPSWTVLYIGIAIAGLTA